MIVRTGLGNTLTDVAGDINAGTPQNIFSDIGSGLGNGDGWAVLFLVVAGWAVVKILKAPKRIAESAKRIKFSSPVSIGGVRKKKK